MNSEIEPNLSASRQTRRSLLVAVGAGFTSGCLRLSESDSINTTDGDAGATTEAVEEESDGTGTENPSSGDENSNADSSAGTETVTISTGSPEAVVESYYEVLDRMNQDANTDDVLSTLDPLLHSELPVRRTLRAADSAENNSSGEDRALANLEIEVVQEDLSVDELSSLSSQEYVVYDLSEDEAAAIGEENAVVRATTEYEDGTTEERDHLTAPEDGEWQVIV